MGARAGAVISELYNIQNWKCIQLHVEKKNALLHTMSSMLVEVKFMEELIMADSSFWTIRGGEEQALEALVITAWKLRQGKGRK
jgi:hypothetical protein